MEIYFETKNLKFLKMIVENLGVVYFQCAAELLWVNFEKYEFNNKHITQRNDNFNRELF